MRLSFLLPLIVAVFLSSFVSSYTVYAQAWKFIEDKNVGWGVDHDVIHLGNVRDDFRQIKLRVTDGPLKMYDMKIYFDNGDVQDVQIRNIIRKGGESRVIDLVGGLRHISRIEFWYETRGYSRGKARVAVWGKR